LGGSIGIVAGLAFAALAARSKPKSAGEALYTALRAELVKVVLMILLLWVVLATYRDVVAIGLIGTFIATVLIFTMAVWVREK
jgi:ATP synthase protein I